MVTKYGIKVIKQTLSRRLVLVPLMYQNADHETTSLRAEEMMETKPASLKKDLSFT